MAVGPIQPPSPEQRPGDRPLPPGRDDATPEQATEERFGPLRITRVEKDDGRALILYSHDEQPRPQAGDASAQEPDDERDRA